MPWDGDVEAIKFTDKNRERARVERLAKRAAEMAAISAERKQRRQDQAAAGSNDSDEEGEDGTDERRKRPRLSGAWSKQREKNDRKLKRREAREAVRRSRLLAVRHSLPCWLRAPMTHPPMCAGGWPGKCHGTARQNEDARIER